LSKALGNRSILANPRIVDNQRKLNLKVKFRESFRPFAPAVLEEHALEWFEITKHHAFKYTLLTAQVKGKVIW
jgi:carbamoyltransferase